MFIGEVLPWEGTTLLYPSVSTGNVAQLAVDLILHNVSGLKRVGYVHWARNVKCSIL